MQHILAAFLARPGKHDRLIKTISIEAHHGTVFDENLVIKS